MHSTNLQPPSALAAPRPDQATNRDWASRFRRAMLAATGSLLAAAALAVPASAAQAHHTRDHGQQPVTYSFETLNDQADPTFNQLLGIDNAGVISGYFGSGTPAAAHPNQGYTLDPPYGQGNYVNENVPGSVQTQVTGLNNRGETVGFWADPNGDNYGFVEHHGRFEQVFDPNGPLPAAGVPSVQQLLGVNDRRVAVGFYTDAAGNNHGFTYDIHTGRFRAINLPGFTSLTATAIDDDGTVAGFGQDATGNTEGFVLSPNGRVEILTGPQGGRDVQVLGINDDGEVVGSYMDGTGATHGFTWTAHSGYTTIDDPNGMKGNNAITVVNGVNDHGQLVGFYLDDNGNTDGMLVMPSH
jgi:hypothetical protein